MSCLPTSLVACMPACRRPGGEGPPTRACLPAGDPVGLIHHLGLGLRAFVGSHSRMLTQQDSGLARLQGLYLGLQMLGKDIALALSSWAAKASGTGRKALAMLGLDAGLAGGHRKGLS